MADFLPSPSEQLSLAVAGPNLVLADPTGRIVQVDRASLAVRRVVRDPARPRAVAVSGGRVYVADGDGVALRRAATLAPISVRASSAAMLASSPLVATGRDGRVCELRAGSAICGRVGFAPTGLGASGTLVFAAGGSPGRVVVLRRSGGKLVPAGRPVAVSRPYGQLVAFRGRVYVPSRRGIAVVDPRQLVASSIRLPVSPAAIWIAPTGRLYAALPATGRVAILDRGRPPRFVRVGGRPVAVAGTRATIFVADASGRITRIDAATGARRGSARVLTPGAAPPTRAVLDRIRARTNGEKTILVLTIAGGRRPRRARRRDRRRTSDARALAGRDRLLRGRPLVRRSCPARRPAAGPARRPPLGARTSVRGSRGAGHEERRRGRAAEDVGSPGPARPSVASTRASWRRVAATATTAAIAPRAAEADDDEPRLLQRRLSRQPTRNVKRLTTVRPARRTLSQVPRGSACP